MKNRVFDCAMCFRLCEIHRIVCQMVCLIGNSKAPNLPSSQNGRLRRDGKSSQSNTKFFKAAGFRFILTKTRFLAEKHEDVSGAWQQRVKLPITVATRAKSPRFQSPADEIENLSKVCQTCLLVQRAQQACQTCRFRNWGVNQTKIPNLPSLPFSVLVPLKHTHN